MCRATLHGGDLELGLALGDFVTLVGIWIFALFVGDEPGLRTPWGAIAYWAPGVVVAVSAVYVSQRNGGRSALNTVELALAEALGGTTASSQQEETRQRRTPE